jgi:hypothetical protein
MVNRVAFARKKIAAVAKWKASGLSQAEFCRREGMQQWQLSDWKRFVESRQEEVQDFPGQPHLDEDSGTLQERKQTGRRKLRQHRDETVAESQPFVPVRVVDVAASDDTHKASNVVDFVLELVLKGGQMIRVASNCEPQFLGAIVSALDS